MTNNEKIVECPRCGKEVCVHISVVDDITFVQQDESNQPSNTELEGPELVYCIDCKKAFKCHDKEYLLNNPGHDVFCEDFVSNQSLTTKEEK